MQTIAIAAGVLLAGCARVGPRTPADIIDRPGDGLYRVVRVIDGDTLVIALPMADGRCLALPCRLLGVDTPERGQDGFQDAKDALAHLAGGRVRVAIPGRPRGKYGRWLVQLYTLDGRDVNAQLARRWPGR